MSELVWHYTPIENLEGFSKNYFIGKRADYFEDKGEISYCLDNMPDELKKIIKPNTRYFVGCFSGILDDMRQWETRTKENGGVALGFDADDLLKNRTEDCYFSKVYYNVDEYRKYLNENINSNRIFQDARLHDYAVIAPIFLKRPVFAWEDEYRYVCINDREDFHIGEKKIPFRILFMLNIMKIKRIIISPFWMKENISKVRSFIHEMKYDIPYCESGCVVK